MLIMVAFVVFAAWGSVVLAAAIHHGRVVRRAHHVAVAVAVVGVLLVMPVLLIGTFGVPGSRYWWLGVAGSLGYAGLTLLALSAGAWLLLDTRFVWRERRRILPFLFSRRPGGEA
jgi:hypothetical protein